MRAVKWWLRACVLGIVLGVAGQAAADQPASPPAKDSEGFEPVTTDMIAKGETIPASRLVATAYGFIFAAVVVYVGSVAARTRRVEDDLAQLKKKIEAKLGG